MVQSVTFLHSPSSYLIIRYTWDTHLHICFQEPKGEFGPKIKEILSRETPFNVVVDASTSGKLTKDHVKRSLHNAFIPDVTNDNLLLLDSWSIQTDEHIFKNEEIIQMLDNKTIHTEAIPPKTTRFVQPLDLYYFRQYKIVIHRSEVCFRHEIISMNTTEKLYDRIFIIILHYIVYHQFHSPALQDMLLYAWQKCGYHQNTSEEFPECPRFYVPN